MLCVTAVRADDVAVDAMMTAGPNGREITAYTADAQKLYATFKTKGVSQGDKIRAVWIADDVGDAASPGTKIDEETLDAKGDMEGEFSLSRPSPGWPLGKYHVEIYVNSHLATKVPFEIKAAGKSKKEKDKDEEEKEDEDSGD
ncbi:MAG TPA: hypothetical protein VFA58_06055 [Chthoniobacterales bacterium]|nr:hypothetical protein [Chthoniobacterales bacterium]